MHVEGRNLQPKKEEQRLSEWQQAIANHIQQGSEYLQQKADPKEEELHKGILQENL
mgnify:CR=1 FL=1